MLVINIFFIFLYHKKSSPPTGFKKHRNIVGSKSNQEHIHNSYVSLVTIIGPGVAHRSFLDCLV